jgi:MraZ protein
MFRGINELSLDPKGRLAVPTRYREVLEELCRGQFVLTIDVQYACLRLYPLPVWQVLEAQLEGLPGTDPDVRRIQRLLLGYASDLEMDGNGRVLLPPVLRKYAQLDRKIVLVGQGKKFEVWSEENWQRCVDPDAIARGEIHIPESMIAAGISF